MAAKQHVYRGVAYVIDPPVPPLKVGIARITALPPGLSASNLDRLTWKPGKQVIYGPMMNSYINNGLDYKNPAVQFAKVLVTNPIVTLSQIPRLAILFPVYSIPIGLGLVFVAWKVLKK